MGFSKWFSEINSSELMGDVKLASQEEARKPNKFEFTFIFILGQMLFWGIIYLSNRGHFPQQVPNWYIYFAVYLFLSMLLRPQPNYKNLGFLGGLIGNPFTITDDINRFLILFKVMLLPGKIMVDSFFYLMQLTARFLLLFIK
jgi:hypothetical protein